MTLRLVQICNRGFATVINELEELEAHRATLLHVVHDFECAVAAAEDEVLVRREEERKSIVGLRGRLLQTMGNQVFHQIQEESKRQMKLAVLEKKKRDAMNKANYEQEMKKLRLAEARKNRRKTYKTATLQELRDAQHIPVTTTKARFNAFFTRLAKAEEAGLALSVQLGLGGKGTVNGLFFHNIICEEAGSGWEAPGGCGGPLPCVVSMLRLPPHHPRTRTNTTDQRPHTSEHGALSSADQNPRARGASA